MLSFLLVHVCTCHYCCVLYNNIYVGDSGRHSDGGVLGNSAFGQILEDGDLKLPDDSPLPGL